MTLTNVLFAERNYRFGIWQPGRGKIFDQCAIGTLSTAMDADQPNLVPNLVLLAATNGAQSVFVSAEHTGEFLEAHLDAAWLFHNAAFDLAVLQQAVASGLDLYAQVEANRVWCTLVLRRLLLLATEGNAPVDRAGLNRSVQDLLGIELDEEDSGDGEDCLHTHLGQYLRSPIRAIPPKYLKYAGSNAVATWNLLGELRKQTRAVLDGSQQAFGYVDRDWLRRVTKEFGPLTHHVQLRASIVTDTLHQNGLAVDRERVSQLRQQVSAGLAALRARLAEQGYFPGTRGSSEVLQGLIKGTLELHPDLVVPRTPNGRGWSTKAEDLAPLASVNPFFSDYTAFRRQEKFLSTYLEKLDRDRIHPQFQYLLTTGRTSCSQPNVQNLPREGAANLGISVRSCLRPSPGNVFIAPDFCQIELVALALAFDQQFGLGTAMRDLINLGADLHRILAAKVLNKNPDEVTREERQGAKAVSFGRPGGMGAQSLQKIARETYGVALTPEDVAQRIQAYHAICPELDQYLRDRANGRDRPVFTYTGRLRAAASFSASRNTVFQGLAADGAILSLWSLWRAGFRIANFVHDQIVVEVPEDGSLEARQAEVERLMVEAMQKVLPGMRVEVETQITRSLDKRDQVERVVNQSSNKVESGLVRQERPGISRPSVARRRVLA